MSLDGKRFDKPKSIDEVQHHLELLRGRTHNLVNGLSFAEGSQLHDDYFTILGLPLLPLLDYMRQIKTLKD